MYAGRGGGWGGWGGVVGGGGLGGGGGGVTVRSTEQVASGRRAHGLGFVRRFGEKDTDILGRAILFQFVFTNQLLKKNSYKSDSQISF